MDNERVDETSEESLRLYIRYKEYLNAEQVASIIFSLDGLYNSLYPAFDPEVTFPLAPETRLAVSQCHTGNSFLIQLIDGVRQVWSIGGPTLHVTSGFGITLLMAGLIPKFGKGLAEFRKTWYEGTKAKLEVEELRDKKREKESPEVIQFPDHVKRDATQFIFNFYNTIEYAPNIEWVEVNGVIIKGNGHTIRIRESES